LLFLTNQNFKVSYPIHTALSNRFRENSAIAFVIAIVLASGALYSLPSFADSNKAKEPTDVFISGDKRFIDHGDNTITDTKTGLMWIKQDSYLHKKRWLNWFQAGEYIKKLNEARYASHEDWEIPTIKELRSLYEPQKFNSSQLGREMKIYIDPIFAKNGAGTSWSSQENGHFNAFGMIFNNGRTFSHPKVAKSRKAVRAVRHTFPMSLNQK